MAVLHDLEVPVMVIPAAVTGVLLGLDVVAPVHLDERHSALHKSSGEQATLPEPGSAIPIGNRRGLLRQVEESRSGRIGEHRQCPGAVLIEGSGGSQFVGPPLGVAESLKELLAVGEAVGTEDPEERVRAVRTLLAEETRLGMFVGVAVGFELSRALSHNPKEN